MPFQFNFPNPEEDDDEKRSQGAGMDSISQKECHTTVTEEKAISTEVKIELNHQLNCEIQTVSYDIGKDLKVISLDTKLVEDKLKKEVKGEKTNSALHEALLSDNDLIPDKYEGGLKIWECAVDLAKFISTKSFTSKTIAELGCGGGLPGLCALNNGAKYVLFQDFNAEVLTNLTIPNVLLNCEENKEQCAFFSGDWKNLPSALQKSETVAQKYDVILTAETIYNTKNYSKLLDILDFLLEDNGDIFVAAKTYYFGVGGGTRQFESQILEDNRFTSSICWTQSHGISREILHLQRKKS